MVEGSRVTVVAQSRKKDGAASASQFMMELLDTNAVQGEEPPRILHFNPRIRGDVTGQPQESGEAPGYYQLADYQLHGHDLAQSIISSMFARNKKPHAPVRSQAQGQPQP